jgi:hypothetical protein
VATTDLFSIDRKIALAAKSLDDWRGALPVDDSRDGDDPVAQWKEIASKTMVESIGQSSLGPIATTPSFLLPDAQIEAPSLVGAEDPLAALRPAAASWCAHLAIARSLRDATAARAAAMRDEHDSDAYGRPASLRAMLRALARPRQAGGVPEPRAAATIEDLSPAMMDSIVDEEMRRREAAESLGGVVKCCRDVDASMADKADAFLAQTEDEAKELLSWGCRAAQRNTKNATWVDVLAVRRAADVAEGWPSALGPRWLAELARGTELLDGIEVDAKVDAGRLAPHADHAALRLAPPTGAWTFAQALRALGVALRLHGRDTKAPFAAHAPPHDRRAYVLGEAFMALAATPVFHARARGLARTKAESSARRLTTTRLLERRHRALRVRLAIELEKGRRSFLDAFESLASDAIGGETPRALAAFLGAPGPLGPAEDSARFQAFFEGDALAKALVERFDDDWWRNPKAASWIRDRCAR